MSLIITNERTLPNVAIIILGQETSLKTIEKNGDLTIIKSGENIIGVNVYNFKKYFSAHEGAHTLSDEQVSFLKSKNIQGNFESKFSIGKILERNLHPKSDKLFLLKVKTDKELQIVTNSTNSLVGKYVVVANIGATLPSGTEIKHSKVMGVESEGMLCGGETLGKEKTEGVLTLEGKHEGDKYIL